MNNHDGVIVKLFAGFFGLAGIHQLDGDLVVYTMPPAEPKLYVGIAGAADG